MVRRLTAWEEANPVEYLKQQEQRRIEYDRGQIAIYELVSLYGKNLYCNRSILKQDRSAAKARISEPFGKWVAALEFYLHSHGDSRRIPREHKDLYDEIWDVLKPRSHWYWAGWARDPWLAPAYDQTYGGKHVFDVTGSYWTGQSRLILNPKEATPGFINGYNAVYDQLIGNPAVGSDAKKKLKRLKLN